MFSSSTAQKNFKNSSIENPLQKLTQKPKVEPTTDGNQPLQILIDSQGHYTPEYYRIKSDEQMNTAIKRAYYSLAGLVVGTALLGLAKANDKTLASNILGIPGVILLSVSGLSLFAAGGLYCCGWYNKPSENTDIYNKA